MLSWPTDSRLANKDVPDFVKRVYNMVDNINNRDIIRWTEEGDGFIIVNQHEFENHFLQNKSGKSSLFSSFVRQLNSYGFHKTTTHAPDGNSCYTFNHSSFKKGRPELLHHIKRQQKTATVSTVSNPALSMEVQSLRGEVQTLKQQYADLWNLQQNMRNILVNLATQFLGTSHGEATEMLLDSKAVDLQLTRSNKRPRVQIENIPLSIENNPLALIPNTYSLSDSLTSPTLQPLLSPVLQEQTRERFSLIDDRLQSLEDSANWLDPDLDSEL